MSEEEREQRISKGNEFANRLNEFGADVVVATLQFPRSPQGRHVSGQLLRAGSAPGAHYEEARGAQSREDFVYKISLALKEQGEALHWLRVANKAGWIDDEEIEKLLDEGEQLRRMLLASKQTAQRKK